MKGMIIKMLLEDLIKELKRFDDKDIKIELRGIIETNIELKQIEIDEKDKYLIIIEKNDNKIKINLHQLMKINKLNENSYLLEFDQLQTIKIILNS